MSPNLILSKKKGIKRHLQLVPGEKAATLHFISLDLRGLWWGMAGEALSASSQALCSFCYCPDSLSIVTFLT